MPRIIGVVAVLMALAGCASDQSASLNGISIESAPRALNHLFGEFDGLVDRANRSINESLNDGSNAGQQAPAGR